MDAKAAAVLADALRSALSEEDAADVLKWARNPEAVRDLLKFALHEYANEEQGRTICNECEGAGPGDHAPTCRVYLAWAALDDPRAAEAIGAAFDRARPVTPMTEQQRTVMVDALARVEFHEMGSYAARAAGVWLPLPERPPFRLASESEQAARERTRPIAVLDDITGPDAAHDFAPCTAEHDAELDPDEYRYNRSALHVRFGARAWVRYQRSVSDARGMEVVEAEARAENYAHGIDTAHLLNAEGVTY